MHSDLASLRVIVPDHVVSRLVDGSTVLVDVETGRSFSLDEVGTRVWQALTECESTAAALARLQSEYAAPPHVIEQDLVVLLDQLAASNLVRLDSRQV